MGKYLDRYPHDMPADEAILRVRALTDYWDRRYGTSTRWRGNRGEITGKVLGISFSATFTIDPEVMLGEMHVSFIAVKMGGRKYLKGKLDEYMDPAHSLQGLQGRLVGLEPFIF